MIPFLDMTPRASRSLSEGRLYILCEVSKELTYPRLGCPNLAWTQGQALLVLRCQMRPSMRPAPGPLPLMPLTVHEITRCGI